MVVIERRPGALEVPSALPRLAGGAAWRVFQVYFRQINSQRSVIRARKTMPHIATVGACLLGPHYHPTHLVVTEFYCRI